MLGSFGSKIVFLDLKKTPSLCKITNNYTLS